MLSIPIAVFAFLCFPLLHAMGKEQVLSLQSAVQAGGGLEVGAADTAEDPICAPSW